MMQNREYKLIADMHMHTVASTHAYGTVTEMAAQAKAKGLYAIAITDHGPDIEDAPHRWHFLNMQIFPEEIMGVKIFKGMEANVLDMDGHIDLDERNAKVLDWVVASMHTNLLPGSYTAEQCTNAWLQILKNPHVDVIGHSGENRYRYDYDYVVKKAGEAGKLIELNNASFKVRGDCKENCKTIALACKKYGTQVVVDTDAHAPWLVGDFSHIVDLLKEVDMPEELIVNSSPQRLEEYINNRNRVGGVR